MKKNKISALAKQYGVVLGFVLLICIGALLSETFLSAQNLINILKQYAPIVVISCGTTLVIISGQIDLGAGSVVALSGCISVSTYLHTHSLALAILAGLCVGVLTGLINGFVITHYKLAPFIVTLAMQFMARFGGPFPPILRFEKLEILRSRWRRRSLTDAACPSRVHKVFLHFSNLALTKNLSVNLLAKFCDAALEIFKNWAVPRFAAQP